MSHNPWPSPLPGLAWRSYREAWDHVLTKTLAEVPERTYETVLAAPECLTLLRRMADYAKAGKVAKVQATAQVWLKAVKQALAAQRQEAS